MVESGLDGGRRADAGHDRARNELSGARAAGVFAGLLAAAIALGALVMVLVPAAGAAGGERSTSDRPDDRPGPQIHAMYVLPKDGVDRRLDRNGTIAGSVESGQRWLRAQTGGQGFRFDTFRGAIDVSFARLPSSGAQIGSEGNWIRERIEKELRELGRLRPGKLYAVYYDGPSAVCGNAPYVDDVRDVAKKDRQVFATYLGAAECIEDRFVAAAEPPGYIELGMVHEAIHAMAFVTRCAPNHVNHHVSDSPSDLMYEGDEDWDPSVLDVNRDDYYKHGRGNCPDLDDSIFLEGNGWTIRPGLAVPKRNRRVGARTRTVTYEARVRNPQRFDSARVRVCAKAPNRRLRLQGKRCRAIANVVPGAMRKVLFRYRLRPAARGANTRVTITAQGPRIVNQKRVGVLRVGR